MAWTPPSLPDSIVLMSGVAAQCNATQCWTPELTAEILPGKKQRQASIYFPQVEKHSPSNTMGKMRVE